MNAVQSSSNGLIFSFVFACSMSTACGSESSSGGGGSDGGSGGASSSNSGGSGGASVESLYSCVETDFSEARPLSGVSFDASQGGFLMEPGQATFVAHTTQIYLKPDGADEFFMRSAEMFGVLGQTPGLVAWTVGTGDACGVARTMGIWESEEALYTFVASDIHAAAMARTTELSFTGRTTHFNVTKDEAEALTWDVMRERLGEIEPSPLY